MLSHVSPSLYTTKLQATTVGEEYSRWVAEVKHVCDCTHLDDHHGIDTREEASSEGIDKAPFVCYCCENEGRCIRFAG